MNYEVFITAAVTGSGDTAGKSDKVPVTPKEIADAAIRKPVRRHAMLRCIAKWLTAFARLTRTW